MIDRVLADQAVDKLLSTGDARLRRFGGRIFRSLRGETMSDDLRSMLESVKEQLASRENDLRQIVHEVNEVVLEILQLAI